MQSESAAGGTQTPLRRYPRLAFAFLNLRKRANATRLSEIFLIRVFSEGWLGWSARG